MFSDTKDSSSKSTKSFIFSLVNHDNLPPFKAKVKYSDSAIYGISCCGPTFGRGNDIIIYNAVNNKHSYTNFGGSYHLPQGYTYQSTSARNLLAGTYGFTPDEVEVFRQTSG